MNESPRIIHKNATLLKITSKSYESHISLDTGCKITKFHTNLPILKFPTIDCCTYFEES